MINNICTGCRTEFSINKKQCPKCGLALPRQGRKFRVIVFKKNKRYTRTVEGNLTQASEAEKDLAVEVVTDKPETETTATLTDIYNRYLESAKANGQKGWRRYQYIYNKNILPVFGARKINDIKPLEIERFKIDLTQKLTQYGKVYAPKTIKNILFLLSALFNYARRFELTRANPVESIEKPRISNEVISILTHAQRENLIISLNDYTRVRLMPALLIKLLLYTGLRFSEAANLEWRDVDFENKILTIRVAKSGYNESIPINDSALKVLETARVSSGCGAIVFPSSVNGRKITNVDLAWLKIKKIAGISQDYRLHDLRHQFASDLARQGVSLYIIGKLLRHRTPQMTQRYAHLFDETLRAASQKII